MSALLYYGTGIGAGAWLAIYQGWSPEAIMVLVGVAILLDLLVRATGSVISA